MAKVGKIICKIFWAGIAFCHGKGERAFISSIIFSLKFVFGEVWDLKSIFIIRQSIFCDPTKNCTIKGNKENWDGLPRSKSLFWTDKNKGLPIGNLTSQLFGNVYLNSFDHFVKHKLGCRHYGRYVDDIVIVHQDKEYLKSLIPILGEYLQKELSLELHPKKIYLQHFSRGIRFLGAIIKPYRIYIGNQTKGSFYKKIKYWNDFFEEKPNEFNGKNLNEFLSCINSFLGNMRQFNTYKLRKKMITRNLSKYFWNYFCVSGNYGKSAKKIARFENNPIFL